MILWKKVMTLSANKLETLFLSIGSTTLERRVLVERELGYGASRRIIVTTYGSLHNQTTFIYLELDLVSNQNSTKAIIKHDY